jgi:hypothetical protein
VLQLCGNRAARKVLLRMAVRALTGARVFAMSVHAPSSAPQRGVAGALRDVLTRIDGAAARAGRVQPVRPFRHAHASTAASCWKKTINVLIAELLRAGVFWMMSSLPEST